jgi:hypothetical protein
VPVRVSPTDRVRHHIDELFAENRPPPEFLRRDRYQRAASTGDARPGSPDPAAENVRATA